MKASEIRNFGNTVIGNMTSEEGIKFVKNLKACSPAKAIEFLKAKPYFVSAEMNIIALINPEWLASIEPVDCWHRCDTTDYADVIVAFTTPLGVRYLNRRSQDVCRVLAMTAFPEAFSNEEQEEFEECKKAAWEVKEKFNDTLNEIIFGK